MILTFSEVWQRVCAYGGLGLNGARGFALDYDILNRDRTYFFELTSPINQEIFESHSEDRLLKELEGCVSDES